MTKQDRNPRLIRVAEYICTRCKAVDHDKLFAESAVASAINCYKCHAGTGKAPNDMVAEQAGMMFAGISEQYEAANIAEILAKLDAEAEVAGKTTVQFPNVIVPPQHRSVLKGTR